MTSLIVGLNEKNNVEPDSLMDWKANIIKIIDPCMLVVTCWERADLYALLYVMCSCLFVTFPYGVLGQVLFFIVSIPDLCLHPYFDADCMATPVVARIGLMLITSL